MGKPWLKGILRSIGTRMGLVLLTMAGVTCFIAFIAIGTFDKTESKLNVLVTGRLPEVSISAAVLTETNTLTTAVFGMLESKDTNVVGQAYQHATDALDRLEKASARSNAQEIKNFASDIEQVRSGLLQTHAALVTEIGAKNALTKRSEELQVVGDRVISLVLNESRAAENFLKTRSSRTKRNAASSLTAFVEGDIALMNLIYEASALVSQLSVAALAITQTSDPALVSELQKSIADTLPNLIEMKNKIVAFQPDAFDVAPLEAAINLFEKARSTNALTASSLLGQINANQRLVDDVFDQAIDGLKVSTTEQAALVGQKNSDDIQALLDVAVARATVLQNVEGLAQRFVSSTLDVAQAKTIEELEVAQRGLGQLRQKLRLLARKVVKIEVRKAEEIAQDLQALMIFGDPETGIGHETEIAIQTLALAEAESKRVRQIVNGMLIESFQVGEQIVATISSEAQVLRAESAEASGRMKAIVGCSALLLIVAVFLTLHWVLVPIRKITKATQGLAQGDLSEVTGFAKSGGEIGAMASALRIFRDSLVENKRRAAEEADRQEKERRAQQQLIQEEQDEQRREEALQHQANEDKKREKSRRDNELEAARLAKESAAKVLAEEQRLVVSNLAHGMKRLARGDLQVQVDTPFPDAYETLRLDFNQTVRHLNDVVRKIAVSENSINASGNAIASKTDQLSHRTQRGAETLADIASSLGTMTDHVQSSSDRADAALTLVNAAHECSDRGRKIVSDTVDAMREIEDFSKRVAQITDVIDEIAFQTNLLALNAGVEAARAGTLGRGFAVVATEVRELALRSSSAAGEINALISDSTLKVKEGARLVTETRSALEEIDTSVGALAGETDQIAVASKDQANRISRINESVSELDTLTQQNAVMSRETQTALRQMLIDTQSLADVIDEFQMSDIPEETEPRSVA